MSYNTIKRPDFSEYVIHFTKDADPFSTSQDKEGLTKGIAKTTAEQRLKSILADKRIRSTKMPWTNKPAVCFTECTWGSLLDHADHYSRFGIGFKKSFLFKHDGGPAIYLTPALLEYQKAFVGIDKLPFDPKLFAFITPFAPPYATKEYKNKYWKKNKYIDYSHEREWRVPHDLDFEFSDIAFIIVPSYEAMARSSRSFKDATGRDNWLIMDNYQRIETFWPVHQLKIKT